MSTPPYDHSEPPTHTTAVHASSAAAHTHIHLNSIESFYVFIIQVRKSANMV